MKKIYFITLLLCFSLAATAQEFDAVCSTGQTLHYTVTSTSPQRNVSVSCPASEIAQMTGTLEIPSSVTYEGNTYTVTALGQFAFNGCNRLTQVVFPNTVDSINDHAFYECTGLTSLSLPSSVSYIGDYAFAKCSGLTDTLVIPDNVTFIGNSAFFKCSRITALRLSNSISSIEDFTFSGCTSLSEPLIIPDNVRIIGTEAFFQCNHLSRVTLSQSLTRIKTGAFEGCVSLSGTLIIPDSVSNIGEQAFYNCRQLSGIHFGRSLSTIDNTAFGGCRSIVRLEIPNTVSNIGPLAFIDCSSLTRLTLPRTLTHVGQSAFCGCPHLARITCYSNTPPALDDIVFDTFSANIVVYVPCGSVESYTSDNGWGIFSNYAETYNISVVVQSIDENMGSVDITEYPSCENLFVSFNATPKRGYFFTHWNDGDTNSTRTEAVSEDVIYTAYFERDSTTPVDPIGIDDIKPSEPLITAQQGSIIIQHDRPFYAEVYDVMGRNLYRSSQTSQAIVRVPATGIYIVRTDNKYSHKIWVQK
ncbi:MAG: leucine-rich repeat domain-containing protein [Bacteroidales bacterium]|nr:leucine-rich repeat domain-containing protein [Bacteroidales bacterium]